MLSCKSSVIKGEVPDKTVRKEIELELDRVEWDDADITSIADAKYNANTHEEVKIEKDVAAK